MTTAHIIASILGPFYIISGIGLLLNPDGYRRITREFMEHPALTYVGGIMALLMGLLVLAFHNVWVADWTVILTLFGWLATIKGALLMIRPDALLRLSVAMMRSVAGIRAMAVAALLLGLLLTAKGLALF